MLGTGGHEQLDDGLDGAEGIAEVVADDVGYAGDLVHHHGDVVALAFYRRHRRRRPAIGCAPGEPRLRSAGTDRSQGHRAKSLNGKAGRYTAPFRRRRYRLAQGQAGRQPTTEGVAGAGRV